MVQWLGLLAFTAKGVGLIPGWGIKIPHAPHCGQKREKNSVSAHSFVIFFPSRTTFNDVWWHRTRISKLSVEGHMVSALWVIWSLQQTLNSHIVWTKQPQATHNGCGCVPIQLYLRTQIWISYNFHVIKYCSSFDTGKPFKNVKTILSFTQI